jgi:hypothetical protein
VLADALARGEARHFSVRTNQPHIDAVRERIVAPEARCLD